MLPGGTSLSVVVCFLSGGGGGGERGAGLDNRIYNSIGGREKRGMAIF